MIAARGPLRPAAKGRQWISRASREQIGCKTFEILQRYGLFITRETGGGRNRMLGQLTPAGEALAEIANELAVAIRTGLFQPQTTVEATA